MPDPRIRVSHLVFSWPDGTPVLDGLSFALGPARTGLVAPNGAGKSTLLKLLAGELQAQGGQLDGSESELGSALRLESPLPELVLGLVVVFDDHHFAHRRYSVVVGLLVPDPRDGELVDAKAFCAREDAVDLRVASIAPLVDARRELPDRLSLSFQHSGEGDGGLPGLEQLHEDVVHQDVTDALRLLLLRGDTEERLRRQPAGALRGHLHDVGGRPPAVFTVACLGGRKDLLSGLHLGDACRRDAELLGKALAGEDPNEQSHGEPPGVGIPGG